MTTPIGVPISNAHSFPGSVDMDWDDRVAVPADEAGAVLQIFKTV